MSKQNVGGQALIEGVMIEGVKKAKSMAIRKQDDSILVTSEDIKPSKYYKLKNTIFKRMLCRVDGRRNKGYKLPWHPLQRMIL